MKPEDFHRQYLQDPAEVKADCVLPADAPHPWYVIGQSGLANVLKVDYLARRNSGTRRWTLPGGHTVFHIYDDFGLVGCPRGTLFVFDPEYRGGIGIERAIAHAHAYGFEIRWLLSYKDVAKVQGR